MSSQGPLWGGGTQPWQDPLEAQDLRYILGDTLDTALYRHLTLESSVASAEFAYRHEAEYWLHALSGKHYQSARVLLRGFILSEWIPASPGRYFTHEAAASRGMAERHRDPSVAAFRELADRYLDTSVEYSLVYTPVGKKLMVLGGVGSLRLGARRIEGETLYFLGASSTGVTDKGLVVVLWDHQYREVIRTIREYGGCVVDLIGRVQVLPLSLSIVEYAERIPRFCLLADDLEITKPNYAVVSVAVTFPYRSQDRYNKAWSFCSFEAGSQDERLPYAVDWLKGYCREYSGLANPPILSDFDEHLVHFPEVEFPLTDIMQGNVDVSLLLDYQRHYGFRINIKEVVVGDVFRDISGSTIVNRSRVEKSFKRVRDAHDEDLALALVRIAEEINKLGNAEAAELFDGFSEELEKPQPRKAILRGLWDGITAAVPTISQMVDVVTSVSKFFAS
jgi:hypothetical protein